MVRWSGKVYYSASSLLLLLLLITSRCGPQAGIRWCVYISNYYSYYYYSFWVFPISVIRWFFTGVWETAIFTYLGSSVSSTEKDIDTRLTKAWTAIDEQSIIWKSDLTDKMKRSFFQAAVVSILPYGCTSWTLTKRLPTSKSSMPFNNPLVAVPKAPITIGTIVTFMFHWFFNSLVMSRLLLLLLSLFSLWEFFTSVSATGFSLAFKWQ